LHYVFEILMGVCATLHNHERENDEGRFRATVHHAIQREIIRRSAVYHSQGFLARRVKGPRISALAFVRLAGRRVIRREMGQGSDLSSETKSAPDAWQKQASSAFAKRSLGGITAGLAYC
jgi:hypothetical protein